VSEPTWRDYRLFEFDEMLSSATNAPPMIVALVGRPISREIAEKSMLLYWLNMSRMIHRWERDNVSELIDVGGES